MEKISINQNERKYDIESIRPVTAHVLRIVFTSDMPDSYGDIVRGHPVQQSARVWHCIPTGGTDRVSVR